MMKPNEFYSSYDLRPTGRNDRVMVLDKMGEYCQVESSETFELVQYFNEQCENETEAMLRVRTTRKPQMNLCPR